LAQRLFNACVTSLRREHMIVFSLHRLSLTMGKAKSGQGPLVCVCA
jgi:hypothetical protein